MNNLELLLKLATTPEQINEALTLVGEFKNFQEKAEYLANATKSQFVHKTGGSDEDDFWALAEAITQGFLEI